MEVVVDRPVRTAAQSLAPSDFSDIAPCESVEWRGGALVVSFVDDLTPAQVTAVHLRCISTDATEESILTAAAAAYKANQDFLALPSRTTAQNLAQVEALTRQINGLIRYVARL